MFFIATKSTSFDIFPDYKNVVCFLNFDEQNLDFKIKFSKFYLSPF